MDKALFVIIFMYATSFSMLGAQFIIGDVLGITLTNFQGQPVKLALLGFVNQDSFNAIQQNLTSTSRSAISTANLVTAAQAGFELFQLVTGTYILTLLYFFGIPVIFVYGIMGIYGILVAMFIIGHIKDFI